MQACLFRAGYRRSVRRRTSTRLVSRIQVCSRRRLRCYHRRTAQPANQPVAANSRTGAGRAGAGPPLSTTIQVAEQPSPLAVLPSSHTSAPRINPSPQIAVQTLARRCTSIRSQLPCRAPNIRRRSQCCHRRTLQTRESARHRRSLCRCWARHCTSNLSLSDRCCCNHSHWWCPRHHTSPPAN